MNRPFLPRLAPLAAVLALALHHAASPPTARAVSPDIVISQLYGGGGNSGSTFRNDFIELFNRGTTTVSLAGWSVQYASASGTSWQVTALSGSIAPGQHYLVQEAAGSGGTTSLPAPDATGTIAMSATAGKVALVNTTTALTGSGCPFGSAVVDFAGFGTTASCFEGAGPTPAPSNTLAVLRAADGCTDTDNNAGDFATGAPNPRNTASAATPCSPSSTNPSGFGAANPSLVNPGATTLLTVTVSPGQNPTSTGLAVSVDLSSIGGSASQGFLDDGSGGDAAAGDNVFSFQATAAGSTGQKALPATIGDAEGRFGATSITLTVQQVAAVVISQVYGGGGNSGATFRNDFIELFNRSSAPVDITGWSVQYTSSAGSSWQKTDLSGVVGPGQYFLVQEAQGSGGSVNLSPDAVGTIAMSSTAGKVALVTDGTLLTGGGCPFAGSVADFAGYGSSASCFEGSGPTAAPSNTRSVLRAFGGCTDTNNNAADFGTGSPNPRNLSYPSNDCSAPPPPPIPIDLIQGSGTISPYANQTVTTQGVVTAVRFNNGFFIQTPDESGDNDGDPATSEGIFVFTSSAPPAAAVVGNFVEVRGTVEEFVPSGDPSSPPATEISGSPVVTLISTGNPLPAPVPITASDTDPAGSIEQLERFEGMRVQVDSLTVISPTDGNVDEPSATSTSTGVFYGVTTGIDRPFREPGIEVPDPLPPGSPCCVPRFDANPERLRVDSNGQVGAPVIEVTAGAVVTGLVGPLDYSFRTYTILPDPPSAPQPIVSGNMGAIPVPDPAADEFTVAAFNMERFFDDLANSNAPVLTPTAYANRLNKASLLIRGVLRSPDILGVEEVENLGTLQDVADKLNADALAAGEPDPAYQAYLEEGNDVGGIDSGFLVKSARVSVVAVTQLGKDEIFDYDGTLLNDRPPLVLEAEVRKPSGQPYPLTVIVNHLRSLSDVDDPSAGDRVRNKRRAQAEYLANLIQQRQIGDPNERIVSVGDFNAFQFNDGYVDLIGTVRGTPTPADQVVLASGDLVEPDLVDLGDTAPADQRYSFLFDGNAQELDHVLVSANLLPRAVRLSYARANADFPESYRNDATRPERLSDHDPLVAYFSFPQNAAPTADAGADQTLAADASCQATAMLDGSGSSDTDGDTLTYTWTEGSAALASSQSPTADVSLGLGPHDITLTVDDGFGGASSDATSVTVVDATPADISGAAASPEVLWPPNHKLVHVGVAYGATDNCAAAGGCTLSVASDEPAEGAFPGDVGPDWSVQGPNDVLLRAERAGDGDGRVYTITITCVDGSGNASTRSVTVRVPKSLGS